MVRLDDNILYILPDPNPAYSEGIVTDILCGELEQFLRDHKGDVNGKNIKVVGPLTNAQFLAVGLVLANKCSTVDVLSWDKTEWVKCYAKLS